MNRARFYPKHAFTLVEILVCIVIIAVIAAFLFPVLSRAKASGLDSACRSNLKQVATATRLYADDNGGRIPDDLYSTRRTLETYLSNADVMACPSDPYGKGANSNLTRDLGKRVSYFPPPTFDHSFMAALMSEDANHGLWVCLCHGSMASGPRGGPLNDFEGNIHRVRGDLSVKSVPLPRRCWNDSQGHLYIGRSWWEAFTDAPTPRAIVSTIVGIPDAVEVPCR